MGGNRRAAVDKGLWTVTAVVVAAAYLCSFVLLVLNADIRETAVQATGLAPASILLLPLAPALAAAYACILDIYLPIGASNLELIRRALVAVGAKGLAPVIENAGTRNDAA